MILTFFRLVLSAVPNNLTLPSTVPPLLKVTHTESMKMAGNGEVKYEIQIIRGLPLPKSPYFKKENLEAAMDYVPQEGDIIVASYPKTGTTWLQYTLLQIMSKGESFPKFDDLTYKVIPYIEMSGTAAVDALQKPRVYKHHLPYNMVEKNDQSKCIYIYRNPADTFVSYYHFLIGLHGDVISFDNLFEDFITGNVPYGRYFEHVLSFYNHREDPNILMISYEKLHANRREEILRIAKFVGEEYHQLLLEDESIIDKVIEHTSFDYMKRNLYLTHPIDAKKAETSNSEDSEKKKVNFFRKGIVGDGKNSLSSDQQQRLRKLITEIMKDTEIMEEWLKV